MQTTQQLLDKAKKAQGIESDYRLSKVLGVASPSTVTNWRSGRAHPDDETAAQLAQMAGQNVSAVIADLYAQRAKTPEARALWVTMAKMARASAGAAIMAGVIVGGAPGSARAAAPSPSDAGPGLYIMSNGRRRRRGAGASRTMLHVPRPSHAATA